MKITVVGSHLCPDTLYALNELKRENVEIDFKNLSSSLPDLKEYLALRSGLDIYSEIREMGGIGIPCFVLEDGTKTLDLDKALGR
ncbi:glutaredoxin [Romboutsia weinsteinii]|uniref:Glutaredoxin n=1 Tax=Romboutsia weinsteinii TaxID=2020949 RepID=A0A371J0D2_9FIRM|nr:glutaredoxin [Romboutsia weinsteinii]RDY26220.1 glutaredoxin [Romboutsia weinsteinii]